MALKSSLFAGDARVEAIAVSDASNVKYGDRGPHVAKIQRALNLVAEAGLDEDEVYGAMTQAAVLDFKRDRSIINFSYQTEADAIVGKMTIAALDDELWNREQQSSKPMTVRVLYPIKSPADDYREKSPSHHSPMLSFAISQEVLNATGLPAPAAVTQIVVSRTTIDIVQGQNAVLEIQNGDGAVIVRLGDCAKAQDPATGLDAKSISKNSQNIKIAGIFPGSMTIALIKAGSSVVYVAVVVRSNSRTQYTRTMAPHDHKPTRRWNELCKAIKQPADPPAGLILYALCANKSPPESFVSWGRDYLTLWGPVAVEHFDHFLYRRGVDFNEDKNIGQWIDTDYNLREEVRKFVIKNRHRPQPYSEPIWFHQSHYGNTEFAYSFGTIDALYIEFDTNARYVKIWFKDIYEWHPVCEPFYGTPQTGDTVRNDNSFHAAMVEMKDKGARDYWMIGEAYRSMARFNL